MPTRLRRGVLCAAVVHGCMSGCLRCWGVYGTPRCRRGVRLLVTVINIVSRAVLLDACLGGWRHCRDITWVVNNTILLFLDGKNNCYSERRYLLLSE
jgi:hypothetical protein